MSEFAFEWLIDVLAASPFLGLFLVCYHMLVGTLGVRSKMTRALAVIGILLIVVGFLKPSSTTLYEHAHLFVEPSSSEGL